MATQTEEEVKAEEEAAAAKLLEEEKAEQEKKDAWEKEEEEGEDAQLKKEEEAKKAEEEAAKKKEEGEEEGEPLSNEEQMRVDMAAMKERNISQDKLIKNLESQVAKQGKVLQEADMLEELDEEELKKVEDAQESRDIFLGGLWETMLINPKYEDLDQVVTSHNKNLVVTAFAQNLMDEDSSITQSDAELAVTQAIDERRNPHKFYYDNIKLIAEQSNKEAKEEGKEKDKKEVKKKDPEMKDAPGSVNQMGGGNKEQGYWTMSRLNDMDEDDMAKADIPADILNKWQEEKLPK